MNPNPDNLEKAIHATLRGLPTRKAPSTLEARVLAEIVRRQALPWWKRSWAFWPTPVRWTFLILSAALSGLLIAAGVAVFDSSSAQRFAHVFAEPLASFSGILSAFHALSNACRNILGLIPPLWLYGALAAVSLLYTIVFLVGATAYRVLWQSR